MIVQFADLARESLDRSLEVREEANIPFGIPLNIYDLCEFYRSESAGSVRRFLQHGGLLLPSDRPLIEVSSLRPLGRHRVQHGTQLDTKYQACR